MSKIKKVKALFDYNRKHNDELSFCKNDIITLTQQIEGGWWEGTLNNLTGWFPSNYVHEIFEESDKKEADIKSGGDINLSNFQTDIVNHILDGEKKYCSKLNHMLQTFLIPLIKVINMNESKMQKICDVLQSIMPIHKNLIENIEEMKEESTYKIGRLYLDMASIIAETYSAYSTVHLFVVYSLDINKSGILEFFETQRMAHFEWAQIKQQLSLVFDRLARYPLLLKEMERYLEDGHPDRGNIQRAIVVYGEINEKCNSIRKKKERDLDIICATILGWKGERISQLGDPVITIKVSYVGTGSAENQGTLNHVLVLMPSCILLLACTEQADVYAFKVKLPIEDLQIFANNDDKDIEMRSELTGECLHVICDTILTRNELVTSIKSIQQKLNSEITNITSGGSSGGATQIPSESLSNQIINMDSQQINKVRERSGSREGSSRQNPTNSYYPQTNQAAQNTSGVIYRHNTSSSATSNNVRSPLRIIRPDPPVRAVFEQCSPIPTSSNANIQSNNLGATSNSNLVAGGRSSIITGSSGAIAGSSNISSNSGQPHLSPEAARKKRKEDFSRIKDDAQVLQVIESYCVSSKGSNSLDLARLRLSDAEIIRGVGGASGISKQQHQQLQANMNQARINQPQIKLRESSGPFIASSINQSIQQPQTSTNNNNPSDLIGHQYPIRTQKQIISTNTSNNSNNQSKPIGCAPMISGKNKKRS